MRQIVEINHSYTDIDGELNNLNLLNDKQGQDLEHQTKRKGIYIVKPNRLQRR